MRSTLFAAFVLAATAVLVIVLVQALSDGVDAANVTMGTQGPQGRMIDQEPEHFYLFNRTTRRYEDALQFSVDKSKGVIEVRMRAANLTTVTYTFVDKEWARVYLNDTLTVVSAVNVTASNSTKVKFTLDKWILEDRGETVLVYQELKTKEESINETWTFFYRLGEPPKLSWTVQDLDDKEAENRTLDWRVEIKDTYFKLKSKTKENATTTTFKVKDLAIDWADFGTSHVQVSADNATGEFVVTFYPGGMTGDYVVDPSVGFSTTSMASVSWVYLALVNPQNPTDPTEPTRYDYLHFVWYDSSAPSVEIPVDSNPFPVPASITAYVKVYDNWGRSWLCPSFSTGAAGTYTRVSGDLPVCWISVQCWNGIRNDGFHRWAIKYAGGSTWFFVDEPIKYPVVVDDSSQVNWVVWVPEDTWVEDAGLITVTHADLSGRREYVVNVNVTLKREPTTVYIRLYDASTGEGIPWERFIVKWDTVVTPTNVLQAWTDESHDIEVEDFWGNDLYSTTISSWDAPIHLLKVPVTTYSVKMFNQDPNYIHKVQVYYNLVDGPYVEYIAPVEVVELHLKAADYRFRWTPYKHYVAQSTRQFDLTVGEATYFLINGTTISQVVSDVAGVYALQEVITSFVTPDLLAVATELPRAPCGDQFGEVRFIHPWSVVTADLIYNYTGVQQCLLWTPHPAKAGLNYTMARDRLYFSGTYATELYVNWTSNGTTRFHLTTLPATLDLGDGGNYTLWADSPLDVTRDARFRQSKLFYWEYYPSMRKYVQSLSINNSMNVTWRSVNWMVGWPENRSMDLTGVVIYDIQNGVYLTQGENFDVTQGGVYFYWTSLSVGSLRTFRIEAWDANTTGVYDTPSITCTEYATGAYRGRSLYYCQGSWTNSNPVPYTGSLIISFKWDRDVNDDTIIVYDAARNRELAGSEWTFIGKGVIVHSSGVGTVGVGHTARYHVYFRLAADGEDGGGMFGTSWLGLSAWTWLLVLSVAVTLVASSPRVRTRSRRAQVPSGAWALAVACLWSILVISWILHTMGVIA